MEVCSNQDMLPAILFLIPTLLIPVIASVQEIEMDHIVVFIDGDIILSSEIEMEKTIEHILMIQQPGFAEPNDPDLRLERLINRRLLASEARRLLSLSVTETEIENRNHMITSSKQIDSLSDFLKTISMSEDEWKLRLRESILIEKYIEQRIRAFIRIPAREIERYINDHQNELGLHSDTVIAATDNEEFRSHIELLLKEKMVNERLDQLVNELRKKADIRFPQTNSQHD